MRKELRHFVGSRLRLSGIFICFGRKYEAGRSVSTMLLRDVVETTNYEFLTAHIWIQFHGHVAFDLISGDEVIFLADVYRYAKQKSKQVDYGLCHPKIVEVHGKEEEEEISCN